MEEVSKEDKNRDDNYMNLKKKTSLQDKVKEIASGWNNLAKFKLGLSDEEDEKIFLKRKEICDSCENKTALNRCALCGCPLEAKTRSETSKCPIDLW